MPVYIYQCIKCGHKFDYFHKGQKEDYPTCEKCGSKVVKLPTFPGVIDMSGKISTSATTRKWSEQKEKNKEHNQKMGVDIK
jgi:putative FmdB family regulatory protein